MTRWLYVFSLRPFWRCRLTEAGNLYYHEWYNWALRVTYTVFAGYNRHAINKKASTFKTVIESFRDDIS